MKITLTEAKALTKSQRHRLRKKGVLVPEIPRKRGYKQAAEHVEKRIRRGADHYAWQGDNVSARGGRNRALRLYPEIGPCSVCGNKKSERHHKDSNTANNEPENIIILCRRCHMNADGRMEKAKQWRKK